MHATGGGMTKNNIAACTAAILISACAQPVAATWMDSSLVNDNLSDFDSDSIESKLALTITAVLLPVYAGVSALIWHRRKRFPFTGLHPLLLIANNVICIVTLILRMVLWVYWPAVGPPCGLEFLVLQSTLAPYVLVVLIRAWFLLFKNEITTHLNHVSEQLEANHQANLRQQQEEASQDQKPNNDHLGIANGKDAKSRSGSRHASIPTDSPLYRLRLVGTKARTPLVPSKSIKSLPASPPCERELSTSRPRGRSIEPVASMTPPKRSLIDGDVSGAVPGIAIVANESEHPTPRREAGWTRETSSQQHQRHQQSPTPKEMSHKDETRIRVEDDAGKEVQVFKEADKESLVVDSATAAATAPNRVGRSDDLSLLYTGFSGWFVRNRHYVSTPFLTKVFIGCMIGNFSIILVMIFLDPDSASVGNSWTDAQIANHIFSAPPCSVMSPKQWVSRMTLLFTCPIAIFMWQRMRMRPADSFGLYHFMGISGAVGNLIVVAYCLLLAYRPVYAGVATIPTQFLLFLVSDVRPLIRSYTSARERRRAFTVASIAARFAVGTGAAAQRLKQFYRLKVVLRHSAAHDAFHDFTKREFSSENVTFWSEVRHFVRFATQIEAACPDWPRIGDDAPVNDEPADERWMLEEHSTTANSHAAGSRDGSILSDDGGEGSIIGRRPFLSRPGTILNPTPIGAPLPPPPTRTPKDLEREQSLIGTEMAIRTPGGVEARYLVDGTTKSGTTSACASPPAGLTSIQILTTPVQAIRDMQSPQPHPSPPSHSPSDSMGGVPLNELRRVSWGGIGGVSGSVAGVGARSTASTRHLDSNLSGVDDPRCGRTSRLAFSPKPSPTSANSPTNGHPLTHSAGGSGVKENANKMHVFNFRNTSASNASAHTAPATPTAAVAVTLSYSASKLAHLRAQSVEARSWALKIYRDFLAPAAPFQVNVPHDILSDVARQIKMIEEWQPTAAHDSNGGEPVSVAGLPSPPPVPLSALYRAAHVCIIDLMQRDSFRRFVTSPAFFEFIKAQEQAIQEEEEKRLEAEAAAELRTTNPHEQIAILDAIEKEIASGANGVSASACPAPGPSSASTPVLGPNDTTPFGSPLRVGLRGGSGVATPASTMRRMVQQPPNLVLGETQPTLANSPEPEQRSLEEINQGLHTVNESREDSHALDSRSSSPMFATGQPNPSLRDRTGSLSVDTISPRRPALHIGSPPSPVLHPTHLVSHAVHAGDQPLPLLGTSATTHRHSSRVPKENRITPSPSPIQSPTITPIKT